MQETREISRVSFVFLVGKREMPPRRIAVLVVGPDVVGGSQRCEVDMYNNSTLEYLAHELEQQLQFFSPGSLINLIETFDYTSGKYVPLSSPGDLDDRARVRVRCATRGGDPAGNPVPGISEANRYVSATPSRCETQALDRAGWGTAAGKMPHIDRELDAQAELIRQRAASPEARRKFTATTPDYGGAAGRAAMLGKALHASSAVAYSSNASSSAGGHSTGAGSVTLENARRVGAGMSYLNNDCVSHDGIYGRRNNNKHNNSARVASTRASSIASASSAARASRAELEAAVASQPIHAQPHHMAAAHQRYRAAAAAAAAVAPSPPRRQTVDRPQAYFGTDSVDLDTDVTIFCVYNGPDTQRAKALTVNRRRPDLNLVLNTLESKFQTQLCLGYIDPDTAECEEVKTQAQFANILNVKSHRHDPNAGVTFQCWSPIAEEEARIAALETLQRQQQQYQPYQKATSPSRGSALQQQQQQGVVRPTSAGGRSSNRAPSAASDRSARSNPNNNNNGMQTPRGSYTLSTPTPAPVAITHDGKYYNVYPNGSATRINNSNANDSSNVQRVSQHALRRLQELEEEEEERARNQAANSTHVVGSARGSVGGRPSSRKNRGGGVGARSIASVISITSASVLITEEQLRDVFDELDFEGCGFVTKAAVRTYFDKNVDSMGVVDAGRKFEKMLAATRRAHDIDFDEFALVMLKVAQW